MKVGFKIPRIQAKERPRVSMAGHLYTPRKTRSFEMEVALRYISEVNYHFNDAVEVEMRFYFHKPKTVKRKLPTVVPDLDNCIKSVLDGLNGCAYKDDSQVVTIIATKRYTEGEDRIEVDIQDYEEWGD